MLISQEILDIIRSTSATLLRDRPKMFLRLRHNRPDLFESLTPDVLGEFIERLVARCEAYLAFGQVLGPPVSDDPHDAAIARGMLVDLAGNTALRGDQAEAWQIAIGFLFIPPVADAPARRLAR